MAEVRNKINEILEDVSGRIRNPLILSFILVWFYFHWQLVYLFFTIDLSLPIDSRLGSLKTYISTHYGWCGMIGVPLLWSFISLIVYYLIAIMGQAIRVLVGKRLNAFMLSKVDTGSFALKTELEEVRNRNTKMMLELNSAKDSLARHINENSTLKTENSKLSGDLNILNSEYEKAKSNIYNNPKFIEKFSNTMVAILGRANAVKGVLVQKGEVLKSHFSVINGNWNGLFGSFLPQNTGQALNIIIEYEKVSDFQGNEYGEILDFSYEKNLNLIEFKIKRKIKNDIKIERFYLIALNRDELIGLYDENFISFKREK